MIRAADEKTAIYQSAEDLREDLRELLYLTEDYQKKLRLSLCKVEPVIQTVTGIQQSLEVLRRDIQLALSHTISTGENITLMRTKKLRYYETLRSLARMSAAIITADDYQSPSYTSSVTFSMAGRLTGRIKATINDYKRDQHEDAFIYEQKFLKEYIDGWTKFPVRVYATHSGMAAFTTIVTFLKLEHKMDGVVLVGSGTYFESKELLKKICGTHYREIDETETKRLSDIVEQEKPVAVFLDTIPNTLGMQAPNLDEIIDVLHGTNREIYLVIDNTCASIGYQPLNRMIRFGSNLRCIVYESLNKFHQFGLDMSLGGIIWATGKGTEKIFDYRVHLGTNISDSAVISLPTPNRRMMDNRISRLSRNVDLVTNTLQASVMASAKLNSVVYPKLSNHPSHSWMSCRTFSGAFFMLDVKKRHQSVRSYQHIIDTLMGKAKRKHIPLIAGTSFGLPLTRMYLTALRSKEAEPFIRISIGTEDYLRILELIDLVQKNT